MTPFLELIRAMVIANGRVGLNGKAAATVRVLCLATCLFPFSRHIGRYFTPRSRNLEFSLISQLLILDIAPSSQGASNVLTKAANASLLIVVSRARNTFERLRQSFLCVREGREVGRNLFIREPIQQDVSAFQQQRVAERLSLIETSRPRIALRAKCQGLCHAFGAQLPEFRVNERSRDMWFAADMSGPKIRDAVRRQRTAIRMCEYVCLLLNSLTTQGRKKTLIASLKNQCVQKGRQQLDEIGFQQVAGLACLHLQSVPLPGMPEVHAPLQGCVSASQRKKTFQCERSGGSRPCSPQLKRWLRPGV